MESLPEKLAECVNVVGAATSALSGDPRFGDHASPRVLFDLLILEEAHFVTESEFLAAARRARRWILIGEPTDDEPPIRDSGRCATRLAPDRPGRPDPARCGRDSSSGSGGCFTPIRLVCLTPGSTATADSSADCGPWTRKNGSRPSIWRIDRKSNCVSPPRRARRRAWWKWCSP